MRRVYLKIASKMKQYHHVRLDNVFKLDCLTWVKFLQDDDIALSRPFVDFDDRSVTVEELDFFTDSSKNKSFSMGGLFYDRWWYAHWEKGYIDSCDSSIEYLELCAVTVAIFLWVPSLENRRVIIYCDNESVVYLLNSSSSSDKNCMWLLRAVILRSL